MGSVWWGFFRNLLTGTHGEKGSGEGQESSGQPPDPPAPPEPPDPDDPDQNPDDEEDEEGEKDEEDQEEGEEGEHNDCEEEEEKEVDEIEEMVESESTKKKPPLCAGRCRTEIWVWKGVALHGGVAATVAGVALHCATKRPNSQRHTMYENPSKNTVPISPEFVHKCIKCMTASPLLTRSATNTTGYQTIDSKEYSVFELSCLMCIHMEWTAPTHTTSQWCTYTVPTKIHHRNNDLELRNGSCNFIQLPGEFCLSFWWTLLDFKDTGIRIGDSNSVPEFPLCICNFYLRRCDTKIFRGCSATLVLHQQNAIKSRKSAATRVARHV